MITMDMMGLYDIEPTVVEIQAERTGRGFDVELFQDQELVLAFEARPRAGMGDEWDIYVDGEVPFPLSLGGLLDQTERLPSGRLRPQVVRSAEGVDIAIQETDSAMYAIPFGAQTIFVLPQ